MRDLLSAHLLHVWSLLADKTPQSVIPSAGGSDNFKTALITAAAGVIAAAIAAFAATFQKNKPVEALITSSGQVQDNLILELRRRAETAEARITSQETTIRERDQTIAEKDARIDTLEGYLYRWRINPDTGEKYRG